MQVSPQGFPPQQTGCPFATIHLPPSIVDLRATAIATAALVVMPRIFVVCVFDNVVLQLPVFGEISGTIADVSFGLAAHFFISWFVWSVFARSHFYGSLSSPFSVISDTSCGCGSSDRGVRRFSLLRRVIFFHVHVLLKIKMPHASAESALDGA
jgi:curved DNA-binding protein CbpA